MDSQDRQETPRLDVPYVPTSPDVVERMLSLANVGRDDLLYDLGCGEGDIVVPAARKRGARGVGIDLNPVRIAEAQANAKKAGVADKVTFMLGNLYEADFSLATVVTLYLLPSVNAKLRPQLWKKLKAGTRVVSHDFDMGEIWPAERRVEAGGAVIYLWTITEAHKRAVHT